MKPINRHSVYDVEMVLEKLCPRSEGQARSLAFLSDAINIARGIDNNNWNINVDKDGNFIRFNVGQEYCIELRAVDLLVLTMRDSLARTVENKELPMLYRGYRRKTKITSAYLSDVPDALAKVPGSVGCVIKYEHTPVALPYLKEPNSEFLRNAITTTTLHSNSRRAHSIGFIFFLNRYCNTNLPNPTYSVMSKTDFYERQVDDERQARKMSTSELEKRARSIQRSGVVFVETMQRQYLRNPYIAEYIRRMANGICADCHNPAPFRVKGTNEPFLEVHHIISLADGGEDTIENTVALCPNCHRKRHFG